MAIPAFNEEKSIGYVIGSLRRHLGTQCRVVVVDDGSSDRTSEIAAKSGADFVVRHLRNRGVAMAYRCAVQAALRLKPDIICTIDADGQYDPADVKKLVRPIIEGQAEVVLGSRFCMTKGYNGVPILNFMSNRLMSIFVSLLAGRSLHDVESGFRAMKYDAAADMELLGWVSFSHDMILDASWKKHRIIEVPVVARYYENRKSRAIDNVASYGLRAMLAMLVKIVSHHLRPSFARRKLARCQIIHISDGLKRVASSLEGIASYLKAFPAVEQELPR